MVAKHNLSFQHRLEKNLMTCENLDNQNHYYNLYPHMLRISLYQIIRIGSESIP